MICRTVLITCCPFGALSARRAGSAIGRGLVAGGWQADLCPIHLEDEGRVVPARRDVRALLGALDFDARMRAARAVVLGEWRLEARSPADSATFEIATRARQAGVPTYAVTGENLLDAFDARMFDIQLILEASSVRALEAAGRRLARLV